MLLMKKVFFDAIRSGRKTTTLRYWRRPCVREDTVHRVRGLGKLRIDKVRCVRPEKLTETDARNDGFENLASLRKTLCEMYSEAERKERRLYQIHFTFLQADEQTVDLAGRDAEALQSGH